MRTQNDKTISFFPLMAEDISKYSIWWNFTPVCIGWRGFIELWNYVRFYKEILYTMFQNKAGTHLKLSLCFGIHSNLQPSPQQTIIVACAPTWDIDNKK